MNIKPHRQIDDLMFGLSTPTDCVAEFGEPNRVAKNRSNEQELHYDDFIVRFDATNGRLRECTLLPSKTACIQTKTDTVSVTWDRQFLDSACKLDGAPALAHGFIILKKLGIAITGLHDGDDSQIALTAFSGGDFDEFYQEGDAFDVSSIP